MKRIKAKKAGLPRRRSRTASVHDGKQDILPHRLNFGLRKQAVQELFALPFLAAEPADEPFLAFVLEADHEEPIRTVDGRRHDLELRDLCGVPHASLPIMVFDGSLESRAGEWARHMKSMCKQDAEEQWEATRPKRSTCPAGVDE